MEYKGHYGRTNEAVRKAQENYYPKSSVVDTSKKQNHD
jgi:hypothetical protein